MSYVLQATFSRGQIDGDLHVRSDLELFRAGLAVCRNFITLKRGGVRRRGGTRFMGEVRDSASGGWLIPFEFGSGQNYMLEFGDRYFRVYTNGGRVAGVEVETPYPVNVLPALKYVQSIDTLFLVGGGVRPHRLLRRGETDWAIEPITFEDGPYLKVNTSGTYLTPAATGNPVPVMTSNTTPSGVASSTSGGENSYIPFSNKEGSLLRASSGSAGFVAYQFPQPVVIDAYILQAPIKAPEDMPIDWTIEGTNDGENWVVLDSRAGEGDWGIGERRAYEFFNAVAYLHYRFNFKRGGGTDAEAAAIARIYYHQSGKTQMPFTLTASAPDGINGGAGFRPGDVGRHLRLLGSDSLWRWATIESVLSPTEIKIRLYRQALLDTDNITSFRLGAWSETTGWPTSIAWHRDRLAFAGTDEEPQTVWETESGDYASFRVHDKVEAADGISVGINAAQVNRINWMVDKDNLLLGTSKAIRTLAKERADDTYGPDNVRQHLETNFGANDIPPVVVGPSAIYFGRYGTEIREIAYDLNSNGLQSRSLTDVHADLFAGGLSGATYEQYPSSIIWGWARDGGVRGFTYEREQQVYGCHAHGFGGEVLCARAIPGTLDSTSDEVWLLVRRHIDGRDRLYIELMQPPFAGGDIADAWHLDCAVRYEGEPANTISGLDYLEGEDVVLYADGFDYAGRVENGGASLPNGLKSQKILIGKNVAAVGVTLPWPANAKDGSSMGRKMWASDTYLAVRDTGTLRVGPHVYGAPAADPSCFDELIEIEDGEDVSRAPLRTRAIHALVDGEWHSGGQLVFGASGGRPCTVLAVNINIEGEP